MYFLKPNIWGKVQMQIEFINLLQVQQFVIFTKCIISQCNHPLFQCILCSGVQVFWSHRQRKFWLWLKPRMHHICNINITGKSSFAQGLFYSNVVFFYQCIHFSKGSSVHDVECQSDHHQKLFQSIYPFTHIVLGHVVYTTLC